MKKFLPKALLLILLASAVAAFFIFDFKQYLSLDYLKSQQDAFRGYYQTHQGFTLLSFFLLYVAVTTLSLPGAAILSLAAGALFGVVVGTILVSFASSLGATFAFLTARFFLRDYVQNKFGDKLKMILEGLKKDGPFYLFTLRLIPFFPFFVVNLLMGLTPMGVLPYYGISQLGMLPATIVFVNAGTQISQITSLQGILSPKLILSFVLLGCFPLLVKKALSLRSPRN